MNQKSTRASNVKLLGTGKASGDHSHVKKTTPMKTKAKQMIVTPDINKTREKRVTRMRRDKDVKPL
jgi:hypothetical protein